MERHSLIFRLGGGDTVPVQQAGNGLQTTDIQLLDASSDLRFGISTTIKSIQQEGLAVTEVGIDLLLLASAIFAADKRLSRAKVSQDGWTREIDIYLPVSKPEIWTPLRPRLEEMLGFLTGDLWRLAFRRQAVALPGLTGIPTQMTYSPPGYICLFSGGLDSFVGAVDLLEQGKTPLLISHGWDTADSHHQSDCLEALRDRYGKGRIRSVQSIVGFGPKDLKITEDGESTQRSRSFLFFSVASAAASALTTDSTIVVPENGLISLNIPLDPLRVGSFSTRTTHPYFIARYNEMLAALHIPARLNNPYRHKTKGEMVEECRNPQLLKDSILKTMSCSSEKKYRLQGKHWGHCGHCVPCIIRQAALPKLGIPDPTPYTVKLGSKVHPSNTAEGEHIRSFQLAIHRLNKDKRGAFIMVQKVGPLSDYPGELAAFTDMYCRGLAEVEHLLGGVKAIPHV